MQEMVTLVQETGRYPSRNAKSISERSLAVWLQRRREDARAGRLAPEFREGLAALAGWEGKPRAEADEERWQERLAALVGYRAAGNDWPRHKGVITGEEQKLGVWLHTQRFRPAAMNLMQGKLMPWTLPCRVGGPAGGAARQPRSGSTKTPAPETPPLLMNAGEQQDGLAKQNPIDNPAARA
jgi:hypothetical protein